MILDDFPEDLRPHLIPTPSGRLIYRCLGCEREYGIDKLLYTCPDCGRVLLLHDAEFDRLKAISPATWHRLFDYRKMLREPALKGIYRYHELIGPVIPLDAVIYLGEGHTPVVAANEALSERVGVRFYFKNDGQNPSASFKDRGMASALSYIHFLLKTGRLRDVLAVCASTGDTSAAAALYAAYLKPKVKSAVLLPHKKVTPQQLSQPLGSGARVFEIPGVFDDCMKVVEHLSETWPVALLNSKNAWRILGQESYSYEIAQDFEWDLGESRRGGSHRQCREHHGGDERLSEVLRPGDHFGIAQDHRGSIDSRGPGLPVLQGSGPRQAPVRPGRCPAVGGSGRHDRQPGLDAPGDSSG